MHIIYILKNDKIIASKDISKFLSDFAHAHESLIMKDRFKGTSFDYLDPCDMAYGVAVNLTDGRGADWFKLSAELEAQILKSLNLNGETDEQ